MNEDDVNKMSENVEPDTQTPVDSQPLEPVPTMQPNQPMNKKSKKPLIAGIVVAAAVVVLGGGSALAYNMWYQNPDKVLSDSVSNMVSRDNMSGDGKLTVDTKEGKGSANISSKILDGKVSLAADVSFDYEGTALSLAGNAVYDKDGTLYIKVSKAGDLVDAIIDAQLAEYGEDMSAGEKAMAVGMAKAMFEPIIKNIDGQWIKITPKDIDDNSKKDSDMQCVSDTFNMLSDKDVRNELTDTYKDHKFMVADEKLGAKDGNLGFTYKYDEDISKDFEKALEQTKIGKKMAECEKASQDTKTDDTKKDDESEFDNMKLEIWVDRWSHQLVSAKVSTTAKDDQKVDFEYTPNYDEDIKIDIPTDAMTLDELTKQMGSMFEL